VSEPNDLDVQHLRSILTSDRWLMDILGVVREVDPPGWVVGAGGSNSTSAANVGAKETSRSDLTQAAYASALPGLPDGMRSVAWLSLELFTGIDRNGQCHCL
jgi:hypothetical protein